MPTPKERTAFTGASIDIERRLAFDLLADGATGFLQETAPIDDWRALIDDIKTLGPEKGNHALQMMNLEIAEKGGMSLQGGIDIVDFLKGVVD